MTCNLASQRIGRARRGADASTGGSGLRSIPLVVLALAAMLPACASSAPEAPASASQTGSGPFEVGFERRWVLDPDRSYVTGEEIEATYGRDRSRPRPVLLQLWYPAAECPAGSQPMPYGEYLELRADDPVLDEYARELALYARGVMQCELFQTESAELDVEQQAILAEILAVPTSCHRDAPPAEGPFPLVVYHSGAGSSFEDNAAFAEYLASRGYVVIASAYPRGDGHGFGVDAKDDSLRDMELLVREAQALPFVDASRIAAGGHSLGAQTVLRWCVEPGCPVDAAFLLDTTMDYYAPSISMHAELQVALRAGADRLKAPLLVTASPEAMFLFMDTLGAVDRSYLTVPELDHNEFIGQGLQRLEALDRLDQTEERAAVVRANFEELCESVRAWLDAELRDRPADWSARAARYELARLGGPDLALEYAHAGSTGELSWTAGANRPPTPREILPLLAEQGVAATTSALETYANDEPRSPIYSSSMIIGSLIYDLVERGDVDDAHGLYDYFQTVHEDPLSALRFLARFATLLGKPEEARRYLEVTLMIEPTDAEAQKLLDELDDSDR